MTTRWTITRTAIAVVAAAVLIGLLYWQHRLERMVQDCLSVGGTWDGPAATCRTSPGRLLLPPDLRRG